MATMRFAVALGELQDHVQTLKAQLDKAEEAVTAALLATGPEREQAIEFAKIAADINEGGDLRMWVCALFEDE